MPCQRVHARNPPTSLTGCAFDFAVCVKTGTPFAFLTFPHYIILLYKSTHIEGDGIHGKDCRT